MRKSGFYARLASQNMKKNGKYYLPYLLTCIGTAAMFYIIIFLMQNDGVMNMPGAEYLRFMLGLGAGVIGIFSAVLLFYTNSFLMKRRRKELGLYNILGMEKRHIARFMFWETAYTALIGIAGGLLTGVLLSKLMLLVLCSLLRFEVPFGFEISIFGIVWTCAVFCLIFILNLVYNLGHIRLSKPIELLHGGNEGDREPKTKWLLTIFGFVTLAAGYAIALTVKSPLSALGLFFVAVILVIIGTFCLFTAGSIAILKVLRRKKEYYYKTRHFTAVSGMLHRMKRNAAGLASICILSTMVLVTISTTSCLYFGVDAALASMYPSQISFRYGDPGEGTVEKALSDIREKAAESGVEVTRVTTERSMDFLVKADGSDFECGGDYYMNDPDVAMACFMTAEDYARETGGEAALQSGEVLAQTINSALEIPDAFTLLGRSFTVKDRIADYPQSPDNKISAAQVFCLVIGEDDMRDIAELYRVQQGDTYAPLDVLVGVDINGSKAEQSAFCADIYAYLAGNSADGYGSLSSVCRAEYVSEFYAMYGGFFFLGIFLGILLLMATALIIYYKQVSEGYEDAEGFKIMQQVGMSEREVKESIHGQILTVFFLPILMAAIHIAAAFHMITKLLTVFALTDVGLFIWCTIGTTAGFAAVYAFVYALTARAYYRIVRA